MSIKLDFRTTLIVLGIFLSNPTYAGEWYFNWGYNRDYYSNSDIHVSQPDLGNDFIVHSVQSVDLPQWTNGDLFRNHITVPQFNLRIGYFFDSDPDWGLEFSLDHTKLSSVIGQTRQITGTIAGNPIDSQQVLTAQTFRYDLHNGFNHIMMNVTRRKNLIRQYDQNLSLAFLGKAGIGIVMPHADNTIFGQQSDVGPKTISNAVGISNGWWQLKGWTVGLELGLRLVLLKPLFLEVADKVAYSSMSGIPVYKGRASQSIWMNEWLFLLGFTFQSGQLKRSGS